MSIADNGDGKVVETGRLGEPSEPICLYVADTGRTGRGLFTKHALKAGKLAFVVAGTEVHWVSRTEADANANPNYFGLRRDVWLDPYMPFACVNHSCAPNLGVRGEREFIALRDIGPGEELTVDYAITTDEELWQLTCLCASPLCRRLIRSIQFLPDHIFEKYLPFINPYFQQVFLDHRRGTDTQ